MPARAQGKTSAPARGPLKPSAARPFPSLSRLGGDEREGQALITAKQREDYGRGEITIDDADLPLEADAVMEKLCETFLSPSYEPPLLPASAMELLALSQKPDVQMAQIRRVMERDPLVAAKVLRTAQSSAYAGAQGPVRTLDEAVVRLGIRTLSFLFMEATMRMKVFRAQGYEETMNALGRHSSATAQLARFVSRKTSLFDEYSFLCGLLHDVGVAACLIVLAQVERGQPVPPITEVWAVVNEMHDEVGAIVCRAWGLPPDVVLVTGSHRHVTVAGHVHPVAALVNLADWMAAELGFGLGREAPEPTSRALSALGLAPADLPRLVAEAKPHVQNVG